MNLCWSILFPPNLTCFGKNITTFSFFFLFFSSPFLAIQRASNYCNCEGFGTAETNQCNGQVVFISRALLEASRPWALPILPASFPLLSNLFSFLQSFWDFVAVIGWQSKHSTLHSGIIFRSHLDIILVSSFMILFIEVARNSYCINLGLVCQLLK